ncbi:MAG: phosphatase domain-containing protein, partial [Flavitalea sp.]
MNRLKSFLGKNISLLEDRWDELRSRFSMKMNWNDQIQIVPYRSYGTAQRMYVKGRVLEDKQIASAADEDTILNNLLNMYKRFESDEVPGATLKITVVNQDHNVVTDKEGYFVLKFSPDQPVINEELWHRIPIKLTGAPIPFEEGLSVHAEVMIPPPDAEYGIISDIDDTIVRTQATSLLAMGRNTFLNNARTRLPFPGVAEFYRALQLGRNGKRNNPIFYVSSSPWNLYDLLIDFLDINKIPQGPIMLRDFGFDHKNEDRGHMGHKLKEIEQILESYPDLQFILIGDSGQEDPAIYHEVVKRHPGRILAIYIRDVHIAARAKIATAISESLRSEKVEMLIVSDTVAAAEHAAAAGLIYSDDIPAIEQDKNEDEGSAPGKIQPKILNT